jgi:hypothetical protein
MGHSIQAKDFAGRCCWYCRDWGGVAWGVHGFCDAPGLARVTAQPERGCAHYERLPGVDDDDWEPLWVPPISKTASDRS